MTRLGKIRAAEWIWIGIFLLTVILSSLTLYSTSEHLLDSDSSAELVLAHHLHETGGLLSEDWFYSTEIRAVYTQLVFAPLFGVFEDWHMVRFVGTMILHAIYIAGYGYMAYQAGMKRRAFWIGASLLLMPISVAYGRIVLYQVSYLLCMAFGFWMAGLLLAAMKALKEQSRLRLGVYFILLAALSFLSSLNGYRQLAITHAPLLLMGAVWLYQAKDRKAGMEAFGMLVLIGAASAAAGAGMLVNIKLQDAFSFRDYSGLHLAVIDGDGLMDMVFGLFHQFGYRRDIPLITRMGLASVLALVVGCYCLLYSVRTVAVRPQRQDVGERMMEWMLPCALCVVALIFVFTRQNTYAELYFLPYSVWFIPLLSLIATTAPDRLGKEAAKLPVWITGKKLVACALIGVCFINGLFNMQSFTNIRGFNQPYEALKMRQPEYTIYLTDVVDYLVDEGYDLGHCEFWDSHVITEMSDGKLRTVNMSDWDGRFHYYDWLSLKSNRTMEAAKPFLLLKHDRLGCIEGTAMEAYVQKAKQIGGYVIFDIVDLAGWRSCM